MKVILKTAVLAFAVLPFSVCYAVGVDQYANSVIDFSSQYSATSYAAFQATGAPNVTTSDSLAWAPANSTGTIEFISLGYPTPVYSYGATIREIRTAGFVIKVQAKDTGGTWHTVWQGTDPSKQTPKTDFFVKWPITPYKVNGIRIDVDTNKTSNYELIDSVQLSGVTSNAIPVVRLDAVDTIGSEVLGSTGLFVISRGLTPNTSSLTVQYNITGNAINGSDYNNTAPLTGSVTIPAGANRIGIFIKPDDDAKKEARETVTLTLVNSANYQIMTKYSTGTVTINSDD